MDAAMAAQDEGRSEDALELMNQALASDPANADLKINIAKLVMLQGDTEAALGLLDSLSEEDNKKDEAVKLRTKIKLASQLENTPTMPEIEIRLADNPNDCEALLHKSHRLSASDQYDEAMDLLFQIMTIDRQFQDDAGRLGLLSIFDLLGGEHPGVQKYRRKLFTLLH